MLKTPVFGETGAKRAAAQAQAKQFWTAVQREEELSRILEKYDTNRDGKLSKEEIKFFLQDLAKTAHPPTPEECEYVMYHFFPTQQHEYMWNFECLVVLSRKVMKKADCQHISRDGIKFTVQKADGYINRDEIMLAAKVWRTFCEHKKEIQTHFDRYDVDKNGVIDKKELKALLTDLNCGRPVSDKEVDAVMKEADSIVCDGAINKTEILGAISIWYAHHYMEEAKSMLLPACGVLLIGLAIYILYKKQKS